MLEFKTVGLFVLTAIAEIVGCYLPYLWLRQDKSILLLIPAAISLAACLVINASPDSNRSCLCRVWRCVHFSCTGMVVAC